MLVSRRGEAESHLNVQRTSEKECTQGECPAKAGPSAREVGRGSDKASTATTHHNAGRHAYTPAMMPRRVGDQPPKAWAGACLALKDRRRAGRTADSSWWAMRRDQALQTAEAVQLRRLRKTFDSKVLWISRSLHLSPRPSATQVHDAFR